MNQHNKLDIPTGSFGVGSGPSGLGAKEIKTIIN